MTKEEKIKEIAEKIEAKYQMGGLSDGLYYDFAKDVALEYGDFIRQQTLEEAKGEVAKSIVNIIVDGSSNDEKIQKIIKFFNIVAG